MSMNRIGRGGNRIASLVACALAVLLPAQSLRAAEPVSILDFLARRDQWEQLVGSTFVLEGRVSSLVGREMRLKGTDLKFVLAQDLERPRSFPYVQLVGQLERSGRDFQFRVTTMGEWKTEQEVIRERLRVAGAIEPETYFELAQWAEQRGRFYDDPRLREEALSLRSRGVAQSQKRASLERPGEFYALLDQARRWGLPPEQQMDLLHMAIRAELLVESRKQQPEYSAVLGKIRMQFPGADQPLTAIPADLQQRYSQNPVGVYAEADAEQRVVLHRLLFLETALRMIEQEARPDGSNGSVVAARLERLAPERAELAARYRSAERVWLEGRVPQMSRTEVLEFRNRLRSEGEAEQAAAVVRRWIDAQLARRPKGPATEVDRAAMEFDMVGDAPRALALLAAALQADPEVPGGKELLDRMGYGWHQGKAVLKELIPPPPPDPFAAAIQAGKILVGMSDRQVGAAIGGAPDAVVRIASKERITELWHYPSQRLTIHLEASRAQPQLKVTRIVELSRNE
jgi:hypothetical protein